MRRYAVIDKAVGQTPLACMEAWRAAQPPAYKNVPLAYAGRLDPMASGTLLVLIGEECKNQSAYHTLDKTYEFEVLFGVKSDSGDVLGFIEECQTSDLTNTTLQKTATGFVGTTTFPYPKFSSKTVNGKPLHTWTLEGKIDEIEIPTYEANVYQLTLLETKTLSRAAVYEQVSQKIETIPRVTDERKALGNDFRRPEIRSAWKIFSENTDREFQIARFRCTCSSGTYMRTLAEEIAKSLGTCGLAYSIHRTHIGKYLPLPFGFGCWLKKF